VRTMAAVKKYARLIPTASQECNRRPKFRRWARREQKFRGARQSG
jgi:hypothetical protein